jgi:hypothetical protein
VVVAEEFERTELIAEFAARLLDVLGEPIVLSAASGPRSASRCSPPTATMRRRC